LHLVETSKVCGLDFDIYEQLNGLTDRHHALETVLRFVAQDGQLLFLVLLAALFFARGKWRSRNGRHGVAAAGFSAILALAIAQVIASLWDRPRPYEAHPDDAHLLLAPSPDPSFPSDHATGRLRDRLRHPASPPQGRSHRAHPRHARGCRPRRARNALSDRRARRGGTGRARRPRPMGTTDPRPAAPAADWTGELYERLVGALQQRRARARTP